MIKKTDPLARTIAELRSCCNISMEGAKNMLKKQAMRVIANERAKSEAIRVMFYPAIKDQRKHQFEALNSQIAELLGKRTMPSL